MAPLYLGGVMGEATGTLAPKNEVFLGMPAVIRSEGMLEVMRLVKRVAQSDASVLITGESGSGKELAARALHHCSLRCNMPWVDVNCGALPEHLIESELFGYEKGAFSGADRPKPGLFELADKGTLFLDEIGELDPRMQVKLLRVLDGVPYFRLGGVKKVSINVRILTATNQTLEAAIRIGKFRNDVYHRLSQVHIHVPALRERREDIVPLAEFFLQEQDPRLRFSPDAIEALRLHNWPGNVRELRNIVLRTAILATDGEIRLTDLPTSFRQVSLKHYDESSINLEEMERQMILRALNQAGGHHTKAAQALGISRRTLTRKLKAYGVSNACQDASVC